MNVHISFIDTSTQICLFEHVLPQRCLTATPGKLQAALHECMLAGSGIAPVLAHYFWEAWSQLLMRPGYFRRKLCSQYDALTEHLRACLLACQCWPLAQVRVVYVCARRR